MPLKVTGAQVDPEVDGVFGVPTKQSDEVSLVKEAVKSGQLGKSVLGLESTYDGG